METLKEEIVELTAGEIDIIQEALDSWEKEPHYQAAGMVTVYALTGLDAEEAADRIGTDHDRAERDADQRKRLASRLRVKLYDALDVHAERQDEAAKRGFEEVTANQELGAK